MAEMKVTAAPADFASRTTSASSKGPIVVASIFFAILGFELVNHFQTEWSLNPQYGYGWSVPVLCAYLLWRRWLTRPAPAPPSYSTIAMILMLVCAFAFLPIRFIAEANPDWRLLSWALAIVGVGLSILYVYLVGGWPWARHFAFPILFFLVAVPWPMQFEQLVTQNLMRLVSGINVTLLNAFGIPALQHGNVIEVTSGLIGIEEACSGVRSLQATFMISLFLGELYSFTIARRLLLVFAGALLAFFCNVVRTAILVWIGATRGAHAIERWHDPAGLTILFVCLLGLWLLSLIMRRNSATESFESYAAANQSPLSFPMSLMAGLALWFVFSELAVQAWYGVHQSRLVVPRWTVRWPDSEQAYKSVPIAPESKDLLRYDEGGGATWQAGDGRRWVMYFFRWLPGRTAALFVKIHRPDICLPASGLTMERDNGIELMHVNGVNLPVRSYRFDDHGHALYVFYFYWDARSSYETTTAAQEEDWTPSGRLRAAMRGRREMGAQMLEIAVWDYDNDQDARRALESRLAEAVKSS
jgi:exosortase